MAFELWHGLLLASAALLGVLFLLVLAEPGLRYTVNEMPPQPGSHELLGLIAALADAPVGNATGIEVIPDGEGFYQAMLESIMQARRTVHLEAYIFRRSRIADRFLSTLAERAKAGVRVRIVVDAIGCWNTPDRYFAALRAAGGEVAWYQPVRWYTLKRFNNRTHRELLVVDGLEAFVGGAGIASWWDQPQAGLPPWRDTMVRLQGPVVSSLQAVFAENWLESAGELLADAGSFPDCRALAPSAASAHRPRGRQRARGCCSNSRSPAPGDPC
jgi:cardiolipin synthase A/B